MFRALLLLATLVAAGLAGCGPERRFAPERIATPVGIIEIKGWTDQDDREFCARVKFRRGDLTTSLYDFYVVTPDGQRAVAEIIKDKTGRAGPPSLSLGLGLGFGIGGSGLGFGGISAPVYTPRRLPREADVEACWPVETAEPVDQSRLEIHLITFGSNRVEITTVELDMARPRTETAEARAKDVREVDFSLRGPPARKELRF